MVALFDRGDDKPEPVEPPQVSCGGSHAKRNVQRRIVWEDVPPESAPDDDEEWCRGADTSSERLRLLALRRAMAKARCKADRLTQEERIKKYRRRARWKLPLFDGE